MDADRSEDEPEPPVAARDASIARHPWERRKAFWHQDALFQYHAFKLINDYMGAKADTPGGEMHRLITIGRARDAAYIWNDHNPFLPRLPVELFENGTLQVDAYMVQLLKKLPYARGKYWIDTERGIYANEMRNNNN